MFAEMRAKKELQQKQEEEQRKKYEITLKKAREKTVANF